MKKKLIALVTSFMLVVSMSLLAFATSNFNLRVFNGQDDITVMPPDNNGDIYISVDSMTKEPSICAQVDDVIISFKPLVVSSNKIDIYGISVYMFSLQKGKSGDSGEIEFQIADSAYRFYNMKNSAIWYDEGLNEDHITFAIDRDSIEFMEALEANPNEKVNCVFSIGKKTISFEMNDTTREGLLYLYRLYNCAGGTSQNNLDTVWINNSLNSYKYRKMS